jgi:hypothetical protein
VDINVKIVRTEKVSQEAVAEVANAFAEWFDLNGWKLLPVKNEDDESYRELAERFAADWASLSPRT